MRCRPTLLAVLGYTRIQGCVMVRHSPQKGQTSVDLLLSVALFFLAVSLVLVNATAIFFPTDTVPTQQLETTSVADRVTDNTLSHAHTQQLSPTKLVAFVDNDTVAQLEQSNRVFINISAPLADSPPPIFTPDYYNAQLSRDITTNVNVTVTGQTITAGERPPPGAITRSTITHATTGTTLVQINVTTWVQPQ